ncbi:hypothetical protein [Modestobacter roseus]|uniref:Cell division protein FtsB n=1 Tax=Modestobacter roseus TaxID=1181884 RepID=A0A562IMY2_9ACTN|nr:hypothetical protein [Modestobacter roseus]MQA32356.1 hypothetical protein [Modestobacter roseus]TWH72379.1 hypothetical protein JD78_00890 [Modestobacter roseus]
MSAPARTTSGRAGAPRARTATTGPVQVPRTAPSRRSGPVPRPQLRLVPGDAGASRPVPRPARRTVRRRAPFVLLVVGLLVATTLGLLLLNTAIAVDSLEATRQRTANAEQAQEVARLEQRVVAADSAAELARAATEEGLVPPGSAGHLVLSPDGTSVLVGTAVPAPAPEPASPGDTTTTEDTVSPQDASPPPNDTAPQNAQTPGN